MVDPRLEFDFYSGRWVASALPGGGTSAELTWLAVSQSSDPTGAWNRYSFASCGQSFGTEEGDQPHLGINSQWIAVKDASCFSGTHGETELHVFDKNQLYNGGALQIGVNQFDFNDLYDVDAPVLTYGVSTINNREYLASSRQTSSNTLQVIYSHLEGGVDAPVYYPTTETVTLSVGGNYLVPLGYQTGCGTPCIGSDDDARINSASVSTGKNGHQYIVVSFAAGEPASNPTTSDVLLVATDTTTGLPTSHAIEGTPSVIAYPSIALVNQTNAAIVGYAKFSQNTYPIARTTEWTIGNNQVGTVDTLVSSPTAFTATSRWGDYSTTVLDPTFVDTIWTAQDYTPGNQYQDAWWEEITY